MSPSPSPPGWGSPIFWRYALVTVGLSVATVWAFRGLGQVAGASRGGGASQRLPAPTLPAGHGDSP